MIWRIGSGADEVVWQRQSERGDRKAKQVGGQVKGQNCGQMVVHSATLITKIAGSMLMMTIALMAVIHVASHCEIVGNGDLALVSMLEVNGDQ